MSRRLKSKSKLVEAKLAELAMQRSIPPSRVVEKENMAIFADLTSKWRWGGEAADGGASWGNSASQAG